MPNIKKTIQLYRNENLIVPDTRQNLTAYEVAVAALDEMTPLDGEIVCLRYQEENDSVKTLIAVYNSEFNSQDNGWTILEPIDIGNYYTKDEIDDGNFVIAQALSHLNEEITNFEETDPVFSHSVASRITDSDISRWNSSVSQQKRTIGFSLSSNNTIITFTDENGDTLTHQAVAGLISQSTNDIEFKDSLENIFRVTVVLNESFGIDQIINDGILADGITYNHYFFDYVKGTYSLSENFSTQLLTGDTTYDMLSSEFPFVHATKYEQATPSQTTYPIDPYKVYDLGTLNGNSTLNITFNTNKEISGYTSEYTIRFVVGSGGFGVSLPNTVLWANGTHPTYVQGHTYEINVVNNLAVFGEFY